MTEKEVQLFKECTESFFRDFLGEAAQVGPAHIKQDEKAVLECTGLIGVSGERRGGLYLTAERALLQAMAAAMLPEHELTDDIILDVIGEAANTIAGNVRKDLGTGYMISVPSIIDGAPRELRFRLELPVYVLPIKWRGHEGMLVLGIE